MAAGAPVVVVVAAVFAFVDIVAVGAFHAGVAFVADGEAEDASYVGQRLDSYWVGTVAVWEEEGVGAAAGALVGGDVGSSVWFSIVAGLTVGLDGSIEPVGDSVGDATGPGLILTSPSTGERVSPVLGSSVGMGASCTSKKGAAVGIVSSSVEFVSIASTGLATGPSTGARFVLSTGARVEPLGSILYAGCAQSISKLAMYGFKFPCSSKSPK